MVRPTGAGAGHGVWGGAVEGFDVSCVPEPQRGICGDNTSSVQVGGAVPGDPAALPPLPRSICSEPWASRLPHSNRFVILTPALTEHWCAWKLRWGPLSTKSSVLGKRSWGARGLFRVFTALESHRPQGTGGPSASGAQC